jgi:hypothetical protein
MLSLSAARERGNDLGRQLHGPDDGGGGMTEAPKILLAHHLKTLKLPTFLREYEKLARQCAAEGLDHVQFLARLVELELPGGVRRQTMICGRPPAGVNGGWWGAASRPQSSRPSKASTASTSRRSPS